MHNILPSIYASLPPTRENDNLRLQLDTVAPLFEAIVGRKPKGLPFLVQINVAAEIKTFRLRI
jgi:hypothetical protein